MSLPSNAPNTADAVAAAPREDERNSSLTDRLIRGMIRLIYGGGGGGDDGPPQATVPADVPIATIQSQHHHHHHHNPHPHHHHHHVHSIRIGADAINRLFERYSATTNANQQQSPPPNIVIGPVYTSVSSRASSPNAASISSSSSSSNNNNHQANRSSQTFQREEEGERDSNRITSSSAINHVELNNVATNNAAEEEGSMDASRPMNDSTTAADNGADNDNRVPSNTSTAAADNSSTRQPPLAVTMNLTFIHHQNQNPHHHHPHHHHHHHVNPIDMFGGGINPEIILDGNFSRARQRVYSMLLMRIALLYSLSFPKFIRNFFEYSILAAAFVCFGLLIHMHVMFIRSPLTCLDTVKNTWPKHGILRVQIGDHLDGKFVVPSESASIDAKSKDGQYWSFRQNISFPLTYEQYRQQNYDVITDVKLERSVLKLKTWKSHHSVLTSAVDPVKDGGGASPDDDLDDSSLAPLTFLGYKKNGAWSEPYMVEYSLEYGLLRLSEPMREYYGVPVMKVVLNPETDKCFGDMMARFMLKNFLGYDDVLIGSIKQLAEHENNRGFVRNVVTGEHFRFVNVWMTRTSYLAAAFIMMIFTLFISMLIRYSHQQVFVFVSEFLRSLELQQPVTRISFLAASLITVILALIGMETIMYEFFSDSSITFHVIIMVWSADQFDSLAIQSRITRRHFLRFFYLYQFIFYAYHYRFNGQYSGLALLTTILFTYHSMIFFFHHYELPVLRAAYQQQQQQPFPHAENNEDDEEPERNQQSQETATAPAEDSNNNDSGIDHSLNTASSSMPREDASTMTVPEGTEPADVATTVVKSNDGETPSTASGMTGNDGPKKTDNQGPSLD